VIILFGPAGSGKSLQGRLLAVRGDWQWLSVGQVLRDTKDPALLEIMRKGELVDTDFVIQIMAKAIKAAKKEREDIVLDGYPREIRQAEWLVDNKVKVDLAIVLNVKSDELFARIKLRHRGDDGAIATIKKRIAIFEQGVHAIRDLFEKHGIKFVDVDGNGSVGEVHDRIMKVVEQCRLI
jgi:adenylate kinase